MANDLKFDGLRDELSKVFSSLPDKRQAEKTKFSIHDVLMSGFACMYFQDSSLLGFQQRLQDEQDQNNLRNLFKVNKIPESTQMRELTDCVESEGFRPIFKNYFTRLQREKQLDSYQFFPGLYICSTDGTQYFYSKEINCKHCLVTNHRDGSIGYSHKVLQAAIMHPDKKQVIPLMPEEIRNTDGSKKQDCELNAGKRLIQKLKKDYPGLVLIITGDGLFSDQPFIVEVLEQGQHYLLVAKPDDHKYLMEWIESHKEINRIEVVDSKKNIHVYEWINNVPLSGRDDTIFVNFLQYKQIIRDKDGKEEIVYKNSWVTDLEITSSNVGKLVRAGRCRWKIENECFNTLKNQGYHIEHNYGHGEENLCFNFFLLTLLAFYFHQIFELTDEVYQRSRKKFGSKRAMWELLRGIIRILVFESWDELLAFNLSPTKYRVSLIL